MVDSLQLAGVLAFVAVIVGLPMLVKPFARGAMSRLGEYVVDRMNRPVQLDREAQELFWVMRRQRLCADLRRVEHLIATDTWMSATRQLGNRIAYERLLQDLKNTPDVLPAIPGIDTINSWSDASTDQPGARASGYQVRTAPSVEVLQIGWRH